MALMEEAVCHVPLIDLSQDDFVASEELFKALSTVGFACLTNTGVWHMADEYAAGAKEFFCSSIERKEKYKRPVSTIDYCGWVAVGQEQLNTKRPGDYKECFEINLDVKGNSDRTPSELDNKKCWSLWDKFAEVSKRVLYLIGLSLKLEDPHKLVKTHNYENNANNRSAMRVNWYPKVDKSCVKPGQVRCGEHSDYGSLTLLYCNAPGLQVVNIATGEFVDAGYVEGGIFVNIGDLLQMWSGDVLIASKHRVLIPEEKYLEQDRMSIAFFCQPDNDEVIETLDGSAKYPPVTSSDWLTRQYEATYDKK